MTDPTAPPIGANRHPGDLRRFVEPMHVGEETHHLGVLDGDETGLASDRGRAVAPALLLREVVREAGDDPVACVRVLRAERPDADVGHPPAAATRARAMRSAAAAVEIPSRSARSKISSNVSPIPSSRSAIVASSHPQCLVAAEMDHAARVDHEVGREEDAGVAEALAVLRDAELVVRSTGDDPAP